MPKIEALHDTLRDTVVNLVHDTIPKIVYVSKLDTLHVLSNTEPSYSGWSTGNLFPALIGGIISGFVAFFTVKWTQKGDKENIKLQVELEAKGAKELERIRVLNEQKNNRNKDAETIAMRAIHLASKICTNATEQESISDLREFVEKITELQIRNLIREKGDIHRNLIKNIGICAKDNNIDDKYEARNKIIILLYDNLVLEDTTNDFN